MANNSAKPWERPWTMDDMINNAEKWNLAGDVGLLNSLKHFSDNMFTKSMEVSNNIDNMVNNLDEVSLKLDIAKNEFLSLRNRQFIESRVYEDDEMVYTVKETKIDMKELSEDNKKKIIKESINRGLNVMNKYFDKIEVSLSDSEDESENSYILRPIDLYSERPLPYVIGTEEWYEKWHIGLVESSSDSESEKEIDDFSDTYSDNDLPKDRRQTKDSETSSELDFSNKIPSNKPVANSTFNDSVKQDIFGSSDSEEQNSVPIQAPISNKSFAEQLAAKLGNVVNNEPEPVINKNPIQKMPVSNSNIGSLFSDEPPPLDEFDELNLPKNAQVGLFSGGQGLFDENDEDELFWGQQKKISPPKLESFEEKSKVLENDFDNPITKPPPISRNVSQKTSITKGLFDSDENSDDEMFFKKIQPNKQPYLQPFKTNAPLFDEEPPLLEEANNQIAETTIKKKPTGGVSIFGNSDIFGDEKIDSLLKNRRESSTSEDSKSTSKTTSRKSSTNLVTDTKSAESKQHKFADILSKSTDTKLLHAVENSENKPETSKPKISLFAEDDDLFNDELFENIKSKKFSSNLFDDDEKLFKSDSSSLFGEKKLDGKEDVEEISKNVDLFGDLESKGSPNVDKTKNEVPTSGENKEIDISATATVIGSELLNKKVGLFEDIEEILHKNGEISKEPTTPPKLPNVDVTVPTPETVTKKTTSSININLFDPTPPPDDDWETKSDNIEYEDDQFSYNEIGSTHRSSFFDNEPPSLGPNDSSGITRDQNNTRIDTDTDSSFYPYASSSRRLSTDIFNEQQSNDSLFVTKNKTDVSTVPNLQIIPEITSNSNDVFSSLNLTPSGDVNDLVNSSSRSDYVFEKSKKDDAVNIINSNTKTSSLFADNDDLPGDSNRSNESGKPPVLPKEIENISKMAENNNSFSDYKDIGSVSDKETEVDREVEVSPSRKSILSITESLKNEGSPKEFKPKHLGTPGKLKHNLNINVAALMPGLAPPKKKDLVKSQSLDLPGDDKDETDNQMQSSSISSGSDLDCTRSIEKVDISSFDRAGENVEILPSCTKDRVRASIKRRPSTRKARQEALRKSVPDFSLLNKPSKDDLDDTSHTKPPLEPYKQKSLKVTKNKISENMTKENTAVDKDKTEGFSNFINAVDEKVLPINLFDDNNKDIFVTSKQLSTNLLDDNLFSNPSTPIKKIVNVDSNPKSDLNIFDEDDNLFGSTNRSKKLSDIKTKSIFNSTDDELFGNNSFTPENNAITEDISVTKSELPRRDIFDSNDDLFGSGNLHKKSKTESKNIFDSDDDLFDFSGKNVSEVGLTKNESVTKTEKLGSNNLFISKDKEEEGIFGQKRKSAPKIEVKKSLFDDDSNDDDDLFKSHHNQKSSGSRSSIIKKSKKTLVKKLENKTIDDDPLSALLK